MMSLHEELAGALKSMRDAYDKLALVCDQVPATASIKVHAMLSDLLAHSAWLECYLESLEPEETGSERVLID